jgi:hypothetical protein
MQRRNVVAVWSVIVVGLAGCRTAGLPGPSAQLNRPVDQPCNPANGRFDSETREIALGDLRVTAPKRYLPEYGTFRDLVLTTPLTEVNVWLGAQFTFPLMTPAVSTECTIAHGDTTVTIRTMMNSANNYRVDVLWSPTINNQYVYMQMQTSSASRLKEMRAMIESVRFPVDTSKRIGSK